MIAAPRPRVIALLWIAGGVYAAALLLPGLLLHRSSGTHAFVVGLDYHYSVVFGSALRLAQGPMLDSMRVNFGFLASLTAAALVKFFRIDSFGGWIHFAQFSQLVFLAVAALSAWIFSRSVLVLVAVLFSALPWVSTMSQSVLAPNQSGFRLIGFALLPLALAALQSRRGLLRVVLGAAAGALFLMWNPETGLVCVAAIVFFVFVDEIRENRAVPVALLLAAVLTITALAITSLALWLTGSVAHPALLIAHLIGHAEGYNGHPLSFNPVAIVCAIYASWLVIHCCYQVRDGSADSLSVAHAALGVAAVIWLAYYANNTAYQVLWNYLFLLAFTLQPLFVGGGRRAILATAILLAFMNVQAIRLEPARFVPAPATLQGLVLQEDDAAFLRRHAELLANAPPSTVYFSSTPFTIALMTKRFNDLPVFDPFGETWDASAFSQLVDTVKARKPSCILIETTDSPLLDSARRKFLQRVAVAIGDTFARDGGDAGWDIWVPRGPAAKCGA